MCANTSRRPHGSRHADHNDTNRKKYVLTTTNDFYSLIAQNDLTLVDFYATWCGPCKAMDPIIDRLSAILNKRATIIRIDIDRKEHREIVARYNIVAVPTFVLFRDGEIVWRESGVMPIERIENAIRRQEEAMTAY